MAPTALADHSPPLPLHRLVTWRKYTSKAADPRASLPPGLAVGARRAIVVST